MNRLLRLAMVVGIVSGFALFGLLAWSTGNASRVAQYQTLLLWLNGALALALFIWVVALTANLLGQLRRGQFGARLTARFALAFALIGVLPGALIYTLSVQFMSRSIESWFNVRVDTALESGLALGRAAIDAQLAELDSRARAMMPELTTTSDSDMASVITRLREANGLNDVMVFSSTGRLIAFSTDKLGTLLPPMPPPSVLNQLRLTRGYSAAAMDESAAGPVEAALQLRVIVPLGSQDRGDVSLGVTADARWLQLIQPLSDKIARNAAEVQAGNLDYQELALSRRSLRNLYGITLTLALLLAVFAAIAVALYLSKKLVSPLLALASGTHAVSVGDYRPLPEPTTRDEVAQLTRSFNAMTKQLDDARRLVETNRNQLERSNVYLESVLANLSAGVLVFDEQFRVTTFNQGAQTILAVDLRASPGRPLETIDGLLEFSGRIRQAFAEHSAVGSERTHWQEQFELTIEATGKRDSEHTVTVLARGTHLRVDNRNNGYMVVFDDISEVISANRTVAWGEVARRLAHEIKNPLTPIQLSAERLAMKLTHKLEPADAQLLERATTTIVNQVTSLKHMVDDFKEYARKPTSAMLPIDLNELVDEVLTLYGWDPDEASPADVNMPWHLEVSLAPNLPLIEGDSTQLRQVIHNLLANARDALADMPEAGAMMVATQVAEAQPQDGPPQQSVRLTVMDSGPGFPAHVLQRVFEPYVTTKAQGTGLGLAIVRKIVEEHGGRIDVSNRRDGGARVSILFTRLATRVELDK
ncbi:nitrogen fixation/metabolism regulation signal transduction histidine kinase [Jezberella montanilacus]|uniref:histidine kinase n=1 Tax=Jezberella montanilacus TaxID=323426 RepID=A0A2T0XGQ9_9BURK|nr:ATP-binding protein [Jezberella montanilacus]PRY98138.1 nitrogen fixation/metabolism regulation signal transduction histidine kinase [Jezberella montanilacus]